MANIRFGDYTPLEEAKKEINIEFSIFFDGTLNNKANTIERENNTDIYRRNGIKTWKERQMSEKRDTSYDNDWSNIARMSECCIDRKYPIYIEGIGTGDFSKDDQFGYAMGEKLTGIREKVRKGCDEIVRRLPGNIDTLILDVFGFSRGAAAARNFVYEISKKKDKKYDDKEELTKNLLERGYLGMQLQNANITVERIVVRFLGIYDTVSSYDPTVDSIAGMVNHNFSNDIQELHLNDITAAKKIVHFIATDEHRENFDLTHIRRGEEKTFPGVHSDIGGSYLSEEEWVREIDTAWGLGRRKRLEAVEDRLIAESWYTREQLTYNHGQTYDHIDGRRFLWKTYSYIPLKFMVEKANLAKCTKILLSKVNQKYSYSKDSLLLRVEKRLRSYVFSNGRPYDFNWYHEINKKYKGKEKDPNYAKELSEQRDLRTLRRKYLHWSADHYAAGMDPRSNRVRVEY